MSQEIQARIPVKMEWKVDNLPIKNSDLEDLLNGRTDDGYAVYMVIESTKQVIFVKQVLSKIAQTQGSLIKP